MYSTTSPERRCTKPTVRLNATANTGSQTTRPPRSESSAKAGSDVVDDEAEMVEPTPASQP